MSMGLIGRKLGMTRVFGEDGVVVPVTVIEAGPCRVVQVRDGGIQLGFGARRAKRTTKAELGHAKKAGLDYLVIEKGTIANTIRLYPVGRALFSTPNELEMSEGTLKPLREKPTREELLSHYIHFVLDKDLRINTGERAGATM